VLRAARQWLTARVLDSALRVAPHLRRDTPERLARWLARWGPHTPVLARIIAQNMQAVGVYRAAAQRAHFSELAAHFAGALQALRCGARADAVEPSAELAEIAAARIELDESVGRVRAQVATGRGAILMAPHITNYLLNLTLLNRALPLTVYLRHSKDARRRAAKERWYRASGVQWIAEPKHTYGAPGRIARMTDALRTGHVLFITPDLARKRAGGVPVRFFGREIYLPAGAALLSVRMGVPLFVQRAEWIGSRQRLVIDGPFAGDAAPRGRAQRAAAVAARMQWFADALERFLRDQTPLWYLWGDKRWTRVFRGDPRYVGLLSSAATSPPTPLPADACEVP
jgi:lauroyl/myristoyl acyltransferase